MAVALVDDGEVVYAGPRNWTRRAPGDRFRYSSVGMACVGTAVGRSPRDLVDDILVPLGMTGTAYFRRCSGRLTVWMP